MTATDLATIDRLHRGVELFGRGVVLGSGQPVPQPWVQCREVIVDRAAIADNDARDALVDRLHRAWMGRTPLVVRWLLDDGDTGIESETEPAYIVGERFLFPIERLRFVCFANSYDGRSGEPIWWWARKAERLGARPSSDLAAGDVLVDGGTAAWIDGGPRGPLEVGRGTAVIRGEDVDTGILSTSPTAVTPSIAQLADDQLEAVNHGQGPARIVAPAGSGKTRTLTARVRHLLDNWRVDPSQILVVAYNRRAADELRGRLGGSASVAIHTVHAIGWSILNEARPGVRLIDEPAVRGALSRIYSIPKRPNADPTAPYLEALDEVRIGLRHPEEVEADRDDIPGFAAGFDDYRTRLTRSGEADHGEQIYGAIEALLADPALRTRWQRKVRHVLVDEFQDLTPAYLLLLRLIAAPQLQVFGVGDDDQVIYGYAGADPSYLIDYDELFPGAAEYALATNYRCAPSIVTAANHLLSYNERRIDKGTRAGRPNADGPGLEVVRAAGPELAAAAAERIASWITDAEGPNDIAVLTRVNSSLIPVKVALATRGVPTNDLLGPESLNRTAVRALFAWIRLANAPEDMRVADVIEAVRRPSRGLTTVARELLGGRRSSLSDLAGYARRLDRKQADRWDRFVADLERAIDVADEGNAAELVRVLVHEIGLASTAQSLDAGRTAVSRSSHSDDLIALQRASALHQDPTTLIPWLQEMIARPSDRGGVTLSSVHRVKGMEWKRVIVFGADRGAMPHELATDREEERRVFHVAMTRAMDHALVLADRARPSRYLGELDGTAEKEKLRATLPKKERTVAPISTGPAMDDRVTLRGGLKGVVTARSTNSVELRLDTGAEIVAAIADVVAVDRRAHDADPGLVEQLKQWRRDKSSELGVPAYVVLHDATIDQLAATRPQDERALAGVAGIGPSKLEHYGDDLLAILAD